MKYFEITDSFEHPGRWYLGSPSNRSGIELDPRLFTEGNEYRGQVVYPRTGEAKDYSLEIPFEIPICEGTKPLDFTLGSFNMPVITETIAEQLESYCADAIQLIPAKITGIDRPFEILNVLTLLNAVDRERSEISWRTKKDDYGNTIQTFAGISRLVLKKREIAGAKMFRLRDWELPLIVDETVKGILQNLPAIGIRFDEICTA